MSHDRRPHRRPGRLALAGGLALAFGLAGMAAAWADVPAADPVTVEIPIRYSQFERDAVTVRAGVPVTFVLHNGDPIDHEWIVGDAAVHERHRTGTEPVHGSRPTEVTIRGRNDGDDDGHVQKPGTYLYVCHLPGHEAYGMVGTRPGDRRLTGQASGAAAYGRTTGSSCRTGGRSSVSTQVASSSPVASHRPSIAAARSMSASRAARARADPR